MSGPSLPGCDVQDAPAARVSYADWQSTLVDVRYRLPSSYEPPDLVSVEEAGFEGDQRVRSLVVPDLSALRQAAADADAGIDIVWGYRSFSVQQAVFARSVTKHGPAKALLFAARPGHSEHQLGTTIDFKSLGAPDVDQDWGSEPAGDWMMRNAWRYGFILSFPKNRTDVTCQTYEPWHFRYYGRATAARIHASGLTTRQYLWAEAADA
jgi:zinc D-Ala-D-Ala carboxypeptidase